jgi:hypothetical protein
MDKADGCLMYEQPCILFSDKLELWFFLELKELEDKL